MDNNIERTGLIERVIGIILDVLPILCAFIIVAWAGKAYSEGYSLFVQKGMDDIGSAHSEMVTLTEEDASSAMKVGGILEDLDLISSRYAFAIKAKLSGYDDAILPGTYVLSSDMTMEEMLEKLSVDPATVPEDQADGETPADSGQSDSQEENKDVWGQ
jgi:cell division protein YceG involved in septum cleavage